MNTQQPQGQPGQGQAQAQALRIPMYRPEQMRNLEILSESDKEKYERGLRGLWETMEKNNPDTAAHKQAKAKISEFSRMVWGKVTTMRRQRAEQISGGGQAGPQNPPAANQAALAAQRAGMAQPRPAPASNNGAAPGQPRPAPPTTQFSQHLIQAVNALQINPPAAIANDAEKSAKYRSDVRSQYMKALALMDQNQKKMIHLNTVVKERGTKGPPLSPEEQAKYSAEMEQCKKLYSDGKRFAEQIKLKASQGQPDGAGAQPGPSSVQGPPGQTPRPQPISTTGNPIQAATASVSAAIGAAKNASSSIGLQPATPTTGTSAPQPQAIAPPGQPAQTPIVPPQPQPQVKIEPGSQQQHPPPVNTALAAATSTGSAAGTPTQHSARGVQGVQAATPTTAGPPSAARPLSHPAALALANKSSTNSVPTLGQQGLAGAASASTPGSAGIANTPQAAHSHAHPPQIGAQHPGGAVHVPKMPIPKTLPERAQQIPQPVAAGGGVSAGRPTLGNGMGTAGGTMNQPVIQKNPAFTFEAEGEHILDKKKLNELVRQCCGGGPPGQDGNYLTPDVEEVCTFLMREDHNYWWSPPCSFPFFLLAKILIMRFRTANLSPTVSWIMSSTCPADLQRSAVPRFSRFETFSSYWSASTTFASPDSPLTNCARFASHSPAMHGCRRSAPFRRLRSPEAITRKVVLLRPQLPRAPETARASARHLT